MEDAAADSLDGNELGQAMTFGLMPWGAITESPASLAPQFLIC